MAERLGVLIEDGPEYVIESAGGEVSVSYGAVTIKLTDGDERFNWETTVGITNQDWSEAILGHSGFLKYFDVLFRGQAHEVVLNRNEDVLPAVQVRK